MKKSANLEVKYFTLTAFFKFIFPYIYSSREKHKITLEFKSTRNYFSRESQRKFLRLLNIDDGRVVRACSFKTPLFC